MAFSSAPLDRESLSKVQCEGNIFAYFTTYIMVVFGFLLSKINKMLISTILLEERK